MEIFRPLFDTPEEKIKITLRSIVLTNLMLLMQRRTGKSFK